jgi:hypothetical protein
MFEGEYANSRNGVTLYYTFQYQYTTVGIVYDAIAGFGGEKAHLVRGVVSWSIRSLLFPRRFVEHQVRETIDILDIENFRAKIEAAQSF